MSVFQGANANFWKNFKNNHQSLLNLITNTLKPRVKWVRKLRKFSAKDWATLRQKLTSASLKSAPAHGLCHSLQLHTGHFLENSVSAVATRVTHPESRGLKVPGYELLTLREGPPAWNLFCWWPSKMCYETLNATSSHTKNSSNSTALSALHVRALCCTCGGTNGNRKHGILPRLKCWILVLQQPLCRASHLKSLYVSVHITKKVPTPWVVMEMKFACA